MSMSKLRVRRGGVALEVLRPAIQEDRLVYMAISNRSLRYGKDFSQIAYIGSTKNGVYRIGVSAADRAHMLSKHGVQKLTFHVICCDGRQKMCTWKVLEAGLLDAFRETYGKLPEGNKRSPNKEDVRRAREKFNWPLLLKRIEEFSELSD